MNSAWRESPADYRVNLAPSPPRPNRIKRFLVDLSLVAGVLVVISLLAIAIEGICSL